MVSLTYRHVGMLKPISFSVENRVPFFSVVNVCVCGGIYCVFNWVSLCVILMSF